MKSTKDASPNSLLKQQRASNPFESTDSGKYEHELDSLFNRESFLRPSFGGESPDKNESRSFK